MRPNSTKLCRKCKRTLPHSAFDRRKRGDYMRSCRECRDAWRNRSRVVIGNRAQFVRLCDCGCGEPTLVYDHSDAQSGAVRGHAMKFIAGHVGKPYTPKYIINDAGCWVWQRQLLHTGYGRIQENGRVKSAHVVIYERHVGPVPEGLLLDHLCRNRACVNPAHMEPVTFTENMRRAISTKLTIEKAREIRLLASMQTLNQREIADLYQIEVSVVSRILSNQSWKEEAA